MNHKLVLSTLLFGISSLAAAADNGPIKVCELLKAENLTALGYSAESISQSSSGAFNMVLDGPDNGYSDMCFIQSVNGGRKGDIIVVVESFSKDTSTEDVAAWLKSKSDGPKDQDVKSEEVHIGEATCEFGTYARPTSDDAAAIQYYVACDRMAGTSHLSVNVQQRQAAELPTPSQAKELLDLAAAAAHLTPASL